MFTCLPLPRSHMLHYSPMAYQVARDPFPSLYIILQSVLRDAWTAEVHLSYFGLS
jgi:hypothetical protein